MAANVVVLPWQQAIDGDGNPYAGALLYCYVAGTSTPQPVYEDSDLTVALDNPVEADADGVFPVMYMLATGYRFDLATSDDVVIRTADNIPGAGALANVGTTFLTGAALSVTSGYVVTDDNLFVTVASSGATPLYLPAVADRSQPLIIKNVGAGTVVVTPNGSDVIEVALTSYTIAAAASPSYPSIWLNPGTGTWWIFASH